MSSEERDAIIKQAVEKWGDLKQEPNSPPPVRKKRPRVKRLAERMYNSLQGATL